MGWFSRKDEADEAEIETLDELVADFDQQYGESQRRAAESKRHGSHFYREDANLNWAGRPKRSHRKGK